MTFQEAKKIKGEEKLTIAFLGTPDLDATAGLADHVLVTSEFQGPTPHSLIPKTEDFNAFISAAHEGWILLIKSDERLLSQDYSRLAYLLHHPIKPCYELPIISPDGNGFGLRLFRKDASITFKGDEPQVAENSSLRYRPFRCNVPLHKSSPGKGYDRRAFSLQIMEVRALQNPEDPRILEELGTEYLENKRASDAVSPLKRALELRSNSPQIANALGYAYMELGKPTEAVEAWQLALEANPTYHLAYVNIGVLFMRLGKLQEAISYLNQGLSIQPDDPQLHYNLGVCMKRAQSFPHAVQHFRSALRFNPRYNLAKFELALILAQVGETAEAERLLLELSAQPGPLLLISIYSLATVYAEQSRDQEALGRWQEVLAQKPRPEVCAELLSRSPKLKELVECAMP